MLVGIGTVAASIVGAPVTMMMLVLEMTGNFAATIAVLSGVIISALVTRYSFGYSFSTWRFHLRGLRIQGAHDIGWVSDMTMRSIMQTDAKTVTGDTTLAALRAEIPPGTYSRVFVIDGEGRYQGMVDLNDIHSRDRDGAADSTKVIDLVKAKNHYLLPYHNIREALKAFTEWKTEELPVLDSAGSGIVIGRVSEPFALKQYALALEAHNLLQSGAGAPDVDVAGG
jgi:CIC family chloride channel protein